MRIKEDDLQYTRLPLGEFLERFDKIVNKWSEQRDTYSTNCKNFNQEPVVGTAEFTEAWKWLNKNKKLSKFAAMTMTNYSILHLKKRLDVLC